MFTGPPRLRPFLLPDRLVVREPISAQSGQILLAHQILLACQILLARQILLLFCFDLLKHQPSLPLHRTYIFSVIEILHRRT